MRSCPHCQFLVADDATRCSVCQAELPTRRVPAGVGSSPFVAPGQAASGPHASQASFTATQHGVAGPAPAPPGTAWPPTTPGAPLPPGAGAPPNRGASTAKVLVIVGVLCLVPVLGVASLFLLGSTAEERYTMVGGTLDDVAWAAHQDPGGRYAVDMPGRVVVDTVEMPESYGMAVSVETAAVEDRDFGASVTRTPDVMVEGATFATLPFSSTAVERGLTESGIMDEATIVTSETVPATGDTEMSFEVHGTVDGEPSVMWSRLVIVGPDLYELNAIGPLDDSDQIAAILDRMTSSFVPT